MSNVPHYDVIVIGSGFGGAVAACRLAQARRTVLVLERGRRWSPETFPRSEKSHLLWQQDFPQLFNGWADCRLFSRMWVVAGAGVGGGSLIYANVSVEAKPEAFRSGWPPGITHASLKPYYNIVGCMLDVQHVPPAQWSPRTHLMREAADKAGWGHRFHTLPLAVSFSADWNWSLSNARSNMHSKPFLNRFNRLQGTCVHCGNCDVGCQVLAKNTLDLNYLAVAEDLGAEIRPLHLVHKLRQVPEGWEVSFRELNPECPTSRGGKATARRVIVAAGSVGSTELLLRCRDEHKTLPELSGMLGKGWAHNGDFLTLGFYRDPRRDVSPAHGVTISAAIDLLDGHNLNGQRVFVEDGGIPNLAANFFDTHMRKSMSGRLRRFWKSLRKPFDDGDPVETLMPWFGQAVDPGDGEFRLGRNMLLPWRRKLRLDWSPVTSEPVINAMIAAHEKLTAATGGRAYPNPLWTEERILITPHPLGGCNMATCPEKGVVDPWGKVFGYDRLYVMDGAIVPRPLGLNPSRTIAALAERNVEMLLREPK